MGNKIEILLRQAGREKESSAAEKSSVSHHARRFANRAEAEENFSRLKDKLLKIKRWNAESGVTSFALFDRDGNKREDKIAAAEDFIKITLPGSGKADWVKIIEIYEAADETILTVQPSRNPTEKTAGEITTSHFFTADSTNNFCLEKSSDSLNFYVIGLSEKSNTEDTKNLLESIRNYATANVGHYLGIQESEWQTFCENFLKDDA